jgi:hypothetical protein
MKVRWLGLLIGFVALALAVVSLMIPNSRLTGIAEAEPLKLTIRVGKSSVLVGEPLRLHLRLENRSDKDLTGLFYLNFGSGRLHVLIIPPGQPGFLYWPASLQQAESAEIPLRLITLKAGERREGEEFISYDLRKQDFALPTAGRYDLQAELFFDPEDPNQKVISARIPVEVSDPQSPEDKQGL